MNIILLGAPGAGKGTQAVKIAEKYSLPHISTGDIFRKNIKEQTEIGLIAKSYIDKGQLVPDEVTVKIVENRLAENDCKKGYILDGFPRTVAQAEALENFTGIDVVLDVYVPIEKLMERLTGRRVCAGCGQSYHVSTYGSSTCEKCGGELYTRADDKPETVENRLTVYNNQTQPLLKYYKEKGLLKSVNGDLSPDGVFSEVCLILDK